MIFSPKRSARQFSGSALVLVAASIAWVLFMDLPAYAHAALRHAVPAAGAVLDVTPDELSIEFSENIDLTAVELELRDTIGKAIELKSLDGDKKSAIIVRRTIGAKLAPGAYAVRWRIRSIDGHHTRGSYSFEVRSSGTR